MQVTTPPVRASAPAKRNIDEPEAARQEKKAGAPQEAEKKAKADPKVSADKRAASLAQEEQVKNRQPTQTLKGKPKAGIGQDPFNLGGFGGFGGQQEIPGGKPAELGGGMLRPGDPRYRTDANELKAPGPSPIDGQQYDPAATSAQMWNQLADLKKGGETQAFLQADFVGCAGCVKPPDDPDGQRFQQFEGGLAAGGIPQVKVDMDPRVDPYARGPMVGTPAYESAKAAGVDVYDEQKEKPRFPTGTLIDLSQVSEADLRARGAAAARGEAVEPLPKEAIIQQFGPNEYYLGDNDTNFNTDLLGAVQRAAAR